MHTYIHTYMHTPTYTHTHTYVYICIYIHICVYIDLDLPNVSSTPLETCCLSVLFLFVSSPFCCFPVRDVRRAKTDAPPRRRLDLSGRSPPARRPRWPRLGRLRLPSLHKDALHLHHAASQAARDATRPTAGALSTGGYI